MNQNDGKQSRKVSKVRFDPVAELVAERAAEITIERAAQRLADEADANPEAFTLGYESDPYGESGFRLRRRDARLRAV